MGGLVDGEMGRGWVGGEVEGTKCDGRWCCFYVVVDLTSRAPRYTRFTCCFVLSFHRFVTRPILRSTPTLTPTPTPPHPPLHPHPTSHPIPPPGLVFASMSSVDVGSEPATIVEQQAALLPNATRNEKNSWIQGRGIGEMRRAKRGREEVGGGVGWCRLGWGWVG